MFPEEIFRSIYYLTKLVMILFVAMHLTRPAFDWIDQRYRNIFLISRTGFELGELADGWLSSPTGVRPPAKKNRNAQAMDIIPNNNNKNNDENDALDN